MARKRRLTVDSFLSLEHELTELRRPDQHNAKAEKAAEAGIRYICNKLFPDRPDPLDLFTGKRFGERFVILLRRRWRSSEDASYYELERAHLLTKLAEISARKQKQAPEEYRWQRSARVAERNKRMALEFLSEREKNKSVSPSALIAKIGKRYDLERSAAIAGIKQGLKEPNSLNSLKESVAKKIIRLRGELDESAKFGRLEINPPAATRAVECIRRQFVAGGSCDD
jgi:hypothetical protein